MRTFILLTFLFAGCGRKENLEKAVIKVPSSICGECVKTIQSATMKLEGMRQVEVNTTTKLAYFEYVPGIKVGDIEQAISLAGYDANDKAADKDAYDRLPDCCKK